MVKTKLIILLFCLTQITIAANSQVSFDSTLVRFGIDFQQERIYVQFDKSRYNPGETIWCKAYIMNGVEPSQLSRNIYLDWLNDNGIVLLHESLPVAESSSNGQFDIPGDFSGSLVHVRAYTKWMLNFDSSFLFEKDIPVVTGKFLKLMPEGDSRTKPVIQFFPEGGDLVEAMSSKVAFKAVNKHGLPLKVTGSIIGSKEETVVTFSSVHDGMGVFELQPAAGETYKARWTYDSTNFIETALPVAKPFGVVMHVTDAADSKGFLISRSGSVPASMKSLHIVATMYQRLVYKANFKLEETAATGGTILTAKLPTGILLITLLDDNYTPLAERITYVNNGKTTFEPDVIFDTIAVEKRMKNSFEIILPDTITSNLSVAITDADVGEDSASNIISHLLLNSELKGSIHRPWYYFSNNSDSVKEHLDYVMLTNGWRRFKWNELAQGKLPTIKYPYDSTYMHFGGNVLHAKPAQLKEAGDLYIIIQKDTVSRMFTMPVLADGSFRQPDFIFFDSLKVFYQFTKGRKSKMTKNVRLDNGLISDPLKIDLKKMNHNYLPPDSLGISREQYFAKEQLRLQNLIAASAGTTLKGVTVTARKRTALQMLDDEYASGKFQGGMSSDFDIIDDVTAPHSPNIIFYLQGRVPSLYLGQDRDGKPTLTYRGGPMVIYVNDRKTNPQELLSTLMIDIAYVKVFKREGTIVVYTKKGGEARSVAPEGVPFKIMQGYTTVREFYSPDYTTPDPHNDLPDVRSTLYWNPYVVTTPGNHKIRLSFFNNDITKKIRVIIEGVSDNGRLAHYERVVE